MIALVTGAGTGIGKAIALRLAEQGYDIAVHYNTSSEGAEMVCDKIKELGRRAVALRADLSKFSEIAALFYSVDEKFGGLDLFVNNSGITEKCPFLDTTEEIFEKMYRVNFKSAYFCMQNAVKPMRKYETQGSIVVISSNNFKAHFADVSVYGALKAGLNKMAEHIALEVSQYHIRVNSIAPGWVDTGATRLDDKKTTYYKIPLEKWADVDEIAQAVIYLAFDAARSITGSTLVIDNGALLLSDKLENYYHA